jgi:hypothetical protein
MNTLETLVHNAPLIKAVSPRPLETFHTEASTFPIEAIPERLKRGIMAIQAFSQAPLAMCGQSVLAVCSLIAQAHVDIETINRQIKPCSLFFLTIASSGDRKSTVDGLALSPVKCYQKQLRDAYRIDRAHYEIDRKAYDASSKAIERKATGTYEQRKQALLELGNPPQPPLVPNLTCEEPTMEGLYRLLCEGRGSVGLFTDEGGTFLGGHAMRQESHTSTISGLSKLWDGNPVDRIRAVEGINSIEGKRMCAHLMLQPEVAHGFINNTINKGQGILARFLMIYPVSLMGTRTIQEVSPDAELGLAGYEAYMLQLLNKPLPYDARYKNELTPRVLRLEPEAKALITQFSNAVEGELSPHGSLRHISGFGAKLAEHATRIAGVLAWTDNPDTHSINAEHMASGITLARFYQEEAIRMSIHSEEDNALMDARLLMDWILKHHDDYYVSRACIQAKVPNVLRIDKGKRFKAAFNTLIEYDHLLCLEEPTVINGHLRKDAFKINRE